MATPEENVAIIRRAYDEIFNERRIETIDELWAEDVVDHTMGEGQAPGRAGLKEAVLGMYERRPDLKVVVEEAIGVGDIVASRERWTTADKTRWSFHFYRLADGKVVEEWQGIYDFPAPESREG